MADINSSLELQAREFAAVLLLVISIEQKRKELLGVSLLNNIRFSHFKILMHLYPFYPVLILHVLSIYFCWLIGGCARGSLLGVIRRILAKFIMVYVGFCSCCNMSYYCMTTVPKDFGLPHHAKARRRSHLWPSCSSNYLSSVVMELAIPPAECSI